MTGYNCKYAPIEIMAGFGEACELLGGEADNFDYAAARLHPNMCSHAKAMLEHIHTGKYQNLLFVNCCDSSRRVADFISQQNSIFLYSLDLPTCTTQCGAEQFKNDLLGLIEAYEKHSKRAFDVARFLAAFQPAPPQPAGPFVAVLGARSSKTLLEACRKCFAGIQVVDLTCAENRRVLPLQAEAGEPLENLMEKYARALLAQTPCMRMQDVRARHALLENENCLGVVYSTVKFCDYYDFEFSKLKNLRVPVIRIETDFTSQSSGQLLTRLEGFRETLPKNSSRKETAPLNGKYFAGIDSGSTSTELVVLDRDLKIVKSEMVRTGANALSGARKALAQAGLAPKDIARLVATGYGRKHIDFADDDVTEITCHAKGAKHLYAPVHMIIDIGGQDSKVIHLDQEGRVTGFAMNDKCAAGTGRFLENMAKVLELDLREMAEIGLHYKTDLTISSMCTVFAESEVVSLIAENRSVADIVHGLNKSVAVKTKALAASAKDCSGVMMTGGVANNRGVVAELEKLLHTKIYIPAHPEFCGALGAALIAAGQ